MGVREGFTRGAKPISSLIEATGRKITRAMEFIGHAFTPTKDSIGSAREGICRATPTVWMTASGLGGAGLFGAGGTFGPPDAGPEFNLR
jgi:hypothetical protein